MAEQADASDLKSDTPWVCGFEPRLPHLHVTYDALLLHLHAISTYAYRPSGFISALSHEFCQSCNRVRLTADGRLKLCLNHTAGPDLRDMLRQGADDDAIADAIRRAIADKPGRHAFYEDVRDHETHRMNEIGG